MSIVWTVLGIVGLLTHNDHLLIGIIAFQAIDIACYVRIGR